MPLSPAVTYSSTAKPSKLMRQILWGAVIAALVSMLINLAFAAGETGSRKTLETVIGLLAIVLLIAALFSARVTAKVTDDGTIRLNCLLVIRKTIGAWHVVSVQEDSNFPTPGFGYRTLGHRHKGFIIGGPQVTMLLRNGSKYTVSVNCPEAFTSAVMVHSESRQ